MTIDYIVIPSMNGVGICDDTIEEDNKATPEIHSSAVELLRKSNLETSVRQASKGPTSRPSNITAARRANELLQVIVNAGGITNTTGSDIYRRHEELIKELAKAGEPTSAPVGTRMDRRTLSYSLERLEEASQIRITTIVLPTEGRQRLAYLSSISEEEVRAFVAKQSSRNLEQNKTEPVELVEPAQNRPFRVLIEEDRKPRKKKPTSLHPSPETLSQGSKKQRKLRTSKELQRAQEELNLVKTKEHAWESLVHKVRPSLLKGVAEARLRKLRRSYISGTKIQEDAQWEAEITDAILAAEKNRLYRSLPRKQTIDSGSGGPSFKAETVTTSHLGSVPPAECTKVTRRSRSKLSESHLANKEFKGE